MTEYSSSELELQQVELLPAKETLFFNHNWANVYATNSALALNAASVLSHATATAVQTVVVTQS